MKRNNGSTEELAKDLEKILNRKSFPTALSLKKIINEGSDCYKTINSAVRPASNNGKPGGLVKLSPLGYYVIIPDLHGRMDFFLSALNWKGFSGRSVLTDMMEGFAQVICVGDAFHSERRGRDRWGRAMKEWVGGYKKHRNMDNEMLENFGLLEMICTVKVALPHQFQFLKGNHENIANEDIEGNRPFRKFAYEGEMVKQWVKTFMGEEIFNAVYDWEKSLPLMAEGPDFLVTHCEPGRKLTREEVINAYTIEDVIYNLTWIDNNQAEKDSVMGTLKNFDKSTQYSRIFGGHRAVVDKYSLRQNGRFVQINTPDTWVIAAFTTMEFFRPDREILQICRGEVSG